MQLQIPESRLQSFRLWILVPAAGDLIHATFSQCLNKLFVLLNQHHIQTSVLFLPGDSLVTRARNNLAAQFLSASSDLDTDFCLWLDCDVLFQPESVLQMLSLDLDFVAAPYSKKGIHLDRIAEAARLNWPNDRMLATGGTPNVNWLAHPIRLDEPMPVLEAGTGFWLTKRKVYTQMIDALPHIKFKRCVDERHYGDWGYDFFRVGVWPETQEYLSEDWWFCREWRRLGGTVHCCFWITTNHIGPYLYPMDVPAIADLLAATGGYINGPTKETNTHAPTQIRPAGSPAAGPAGPVAPAPAPGGSNGHATPLDLDRAIRALRDVAPWTADEAAGPRDPGSVGWGTGNGG